MGLFSGNKSTSTSNTSNVSTTNTSVIQDSNNRITSITDAFKSSAEVLGSYNTNISQPIAIMANGSDGSSFDPNSFFKDSILPSSGTGNESNASKVPLLVAGIAVLVFLAFWLLKK